MKIPSEIIKIIHSDDTKHGKLALILKFIVDGCEIDQSKYYILGSYALRKERTISDLDINMDADEFDKLAHKFDEGSLGQLEFYNNQIRWFYDLTEEYKKIDPSATDFSIEVFKKKINEGFPNSKYSLGTLKENAGLSIDEYGHQFMSVETLLEWKKEMGRPKDKDDIDLLETILGITGKIIQGSNEPSCNLYIILGLIFIIICITILIFYIALPADTITITSQHNLL